LIGGRNRSTARGRRRDWGRRLGDRRNHRSLTVAARNGLTVAARDRRIDRLNACPTFRRFRSRCHNHGRRRGGLAGAVERQDLVLHTADDLVVLLVIFEEIRNVQERVAFQADIDERRLHSRQDAGHSSFVNATRQRIFLLPLVVHFRDLLILDNRDTGFVAVGRDY
jgi:hypothetical protein